MRYFSDNAAPVHPKIMQAIADANFVDTAYDGDALSQRLALPHQGVICHREAHIEVDECGAPGFYTGGAKLMLVDGDGAKISPQTVTDLLSTIRPDVHQVQAAAVSITNATEYGLVYRPDEVAALGALCRDRKLALHMDGARFGNAIATLGCSPADVTWRAGVNVLSFGFAKNGGMNAEALIYFDPALADAARYRRKRAGHLLSKGRFLAAQLLAFLEGDLWIDNARTANAAARIIAEAAPERLLHSVEANEIFIRLSAIEAAALRSQGFDFYDWGEGAARLVTSWHHRDADAAPLAKAIAAL
jgi:threonine aldolase